MVIDVKGMGCIMESKRSITSSGLKCIAMITMMIDHFAIAIYPFLVGATYEGYRIQRYIGRIAFPIYCFLLVEGFFYTQNIGKYIGRCFVFALISEIPYNMAIYGTMWERSMQNIYFTLSLGLCVLFCLEKVKGYQTKNLIQQVVIIAIGAGIAEGLDFDYHYMGILFIVLFYYSRRIDKLKGTILGAAAFAVEVTAPLAFIPLWFYQGERGGKAKYLFYFVYPIHLLIFGWIRMYIS